MCFSCCGGTEDLVNGVCTGNPSQSVRRFSGKFQAFIREEGDCDGFTVWRGGQESSFKEVAGFPDILWLSVYVCLGGRCACC